LQINDLWGFFRFGRSRFVYVSVASIGRARNHAGTTDGQRLHPTRTHRTDVHSLKTQPQTIKHKAMNKSSWVLAIGAMLVLSSCATSMTPIEVHNNLPDLTRAKYLNAQEAIEAVNNNQCQVLVRGRTYVAPVGLTTMDDLRNGARGIDEYVKLDGGNAYSLINFKWVTIAVGDYGVEGTQLIVDFDTMFCE